MGANARGGHGYYKVPEKYLSLVKTLGLVPPLPASINVTLAAAILGITRQSVHNWLHSGKLRGTKPEQRGSRQRRRVSMDSILANLYIEGEAAHEVATESPSQAHVAG